MVDFYHHLGQEPEVWIEKYIGCYKTPPCLSVDRADMEIVRFVNNSDIEATALAYVGLIP